MKIDCVSCSTLGASHLPPLCILLTLALWTAYCDLAAYFVGLILGFWTSWIIWSSTSPTMMLWNLTLSTISWIETLMMVDHCPFLELLAFPALTYNPNTMTTWTRNNLFILFHFQYAVRKYYAIQMCTKWN